MTENEPPDPAAAARAALRRVHELRRAGPRAIYDPQLNAALAPVRSHPSLRARCGVCDWGLAWLALDPGIANVIATQRKAPPKQRHGGASDLDDPNRDATTRGTPGWIDAADTGGSVNLAAAKDPGVPTRLKFTCKGCGADYTTKNLTRLRLYLTAIEQGSSTIHLTQ